MPGVISGAGRRPRVPRARVRLRFLPDGTYIECGRCGGTLVGPAASPTLAWQRWRDEGHDTDEHRGIKVIRVEAPIEKVVEKVPGPERVVVQERRIYFCHECNRTFGEGEEFEVHRRQCAALLDQRVRSMLEERIRALGLQDRIRVR